MKRIWIHRSLITAASILFVGLLFTPSARAYRGCFTTNCCFYSQARYDGCGVKGCMFWGNCACGNPSGYFYFTSMCSNGTGYCD
jgi:hypothetical protein